MQKLFITVVFLLILAPVSFAAGASDDADKLAIPTLDNLKGQPIPDTDPPEYYPESAYKLTETQSAIKNTITKYLKNDDGTITPKYYLVTLKQTEYGDKENHNTADNKYFKWTTTNNKTTLTPGTESEHDITYYVNNTRTTALDRITTDQNGADVEMNFINLNITSSYNAYGGAIYNNSGTIGNIIGDFIGNYASSSSSYANGGAIYNSGTIGNIIGDFIGNYASFSRDYERSAEGGAIYNRKTIGNITGDFIGNYASTKSYYSSSTSSSSGGAIYNRSGTIGNITGDFIGNYAESSSYAYGGAIYNSYNSTIGNITGDFIGNYASSSSYAYGGAIYNDKGIIGNITGDFIGNYADSSSSVYGGAIYNSDSDSTIGNIIGDFIGNYAYSSSSSAYGGAINNSETIGNITGDFIGNYASSDSHANGGAIYNSSFDSTIGNITGDFIGNYASSSDSSSSSFNSSPKVYANGGAIYNFQGSTIESITGDFIGNYVTSSSSFSFSYTSFFAATGTPSASSYGGAIYNNSDNSTVGDITGDFIGNYVTSFSSLSYENAVKAVSSSAAAYGGAIYNTYGTIGNITGDFIGNYVTSFSTTKDSSVNNNKGSISDSSVARGGAIYNANGTIGNITGDFIGNYVTSSIDPNYRCMSSESSVYGGAIYNSGAIGNITGDFIGNYVTSSVSGNTRSKSFTQGGAIYNSGTIGETDASGKVIGGISGSFINNYAKTESTTYLALGGAVKTNKDLNFIANDKQIEFSGNYTKDPTQGKVQNAIWVDTSSSTPVTITLKAQNDGSITLNDQIDGGTVSGTTIDRTKQYTLAITGDASGKIILNNYIKNANIILDTTNLYIGKNYVFSQANSLTVNSGTISMVNNQVESIYLKTLTLNSALNIAIDVDLQKKTTDVLQIGSAPVSNNINITGLNVLDDMQTGTDNFTTSFLKGAGASSITTSLAPELSRIYGQIYTYDVELNHTNLTFTRTDKIPGLSGAVADNGDRTFVMDANEVVADWQAITKNDMQGNKLVIQGNGNSVIGENNNGIIVKAAQSLTVTDANSWSNFSSNTDGGAINNSGIVNIVAENSSVTFENNTANGDSNAIHNENAALNLNAFGENNIIFNDKITSDTSSVLNINASNTEVPTVPENAPSNGTIVINNDMSGFKGDVNLYHGTLKIGQNGTFFGANNFNVYGCTLDLANGIIQATSFNNLNIASNSLDLKIDADLAASKIDTISATNTISDANKINVTNINLLSDAIAENITLNFTDNSLKSAVTYTGGDAAYSNIYKYAVKFDNSTGDFEFSRYSTATSNGFNPAILAGAVAQQGAYLSMLDVYDQAFANMDMLMLMPKSKRNAIKYKNKISAISNTPYENSSPQAWYRPYATFENVPLKNGPRVSNVNYGSIFGVDSDITPVKYGFERVLTGYAGYIGSHQAFQGQSIYQNGGVLGANAIFYKGNFFTGLTASAGGIQAEASTTSGRDDMTMLTAGVAAKSGYNFGLLNDRLIIQPNGIVSYTYVNTFNYRTKTGVNVSPDALNAIQVIPGIKIIGNLKNGWQPYLSVSMVFNIMDKTNFRANDASLPNLAVKPYVLYGAGVQKQYGDRFTCYLQTLLRSGGRNGVGLSAGLKWSI